MPYCLLLLLLLASCTSPADPAAFRYSSDSDSARHYYRLGWQEILDNGRWTESEAAYRRAVELDPGFLMAKTQVGRITTDLAERERLYAEVDRKRETVTGDERLLLDVYLSSMELMNRRQRGESDPGRVEAHYELYENNLREFIHRHPEESYILAEYIEVLHARHGARPALDTLARLASPAQRDLPFLLSYAALMEAETGQFDRAWKLAERQEEVALGIGLPQLYMTRAEVWYRMDSLQQAGHWVDRTLQLEPKHILAQRLQAAVRQRLEAE